MQEAKFWKKQRVGWGERMWKVFEVASSQDRGFIHEWSILTRNIRCDVVTGNGKFQYMVKNNEMSHSGEQEMR